MLMDNESNTQNELESDASGSFDRNNSHPDNIPMLSPKSLNGDNPFDYYPSKTIEDYQIQRNESEDSKVDFNFVEDSDESGYFNGSDHLKRPYDGKNSDSKLSRGLSNLSFTKSEGRGESARTTGRDNVEEKANTLFRSSINA